MVRKEDGEKRVTILAVVVGIVLIFAAVALEVRGGWFSGEKVVLNEEYYGRFTDYNNLSVEEYEKLINNKKSFVVLVDQNGCNTADKLREFVKDWAEEVGIKVQKIMFSEMKEGSMHELVKYYPSVVIVEDGKVKAFLRADNDEDADEYNDYQAFKSWIEKYI